MRRQERVPARARRRQALNLNEQPAENERPARRPAGWAIAFPVVAVVLLAGAALALRSDDRASAPVATSTTSTTSGSVLTTSTRASAPVAPAADLTPALFPDPTSSRRFTDPVALARAFATEYLDMKTPSVGTFAEGEPRAGEVPVRAKPGRGPTTTVVVRQLGGDGDGDGWFVTSAASGNLQLETPDPLDTVTSPVTVSGRSRAFEATVTVAVRQDGQLGTGFLVKASFTGGGGGAELEPFRHTQAFPSPTQEWGAVLLLVYSAEDGEVAEATVVRVRLRAAP